MDKLIFKDVVCDLFYDLNKLTKRSEILYNEVLIDYNGSLLRGDITIDMSRLAIKEQIKFINDISNIISDYKII